MLDTSKIGGVLFNVGTVIAYKVIAEKDLMNSTRGRYKDTGKTRNCFFGYRIDKLFRSTIDRIRRIKFYE
jgi:hypothetical protein